SPRRDLCAVIFASFFPLVIAYLYFVVLADSGQAGHELVFVAYSIGKIVQFPFPLVYVLLFERQAIKPPSFHSRGVVLGLAFGAIVAASILGLYWGWLKHSPL